MVYGAFLTLSYTATVLLNVRIWRQMARSFALITTGEMQMREMQRQLSVVLLLQAVVPFVTEVLPGSFVSAVFLLSLPLRYECYLVTISYTWMPVINPLMALGLIQPYRTALCRLLVCRKGGEEGNPLTVNPVSNAGGVTVVRVSSVYPQQQID